MTKIILFIITNFILNILFIVFLKNTRENDIKEIFNRNLSVSYTHLDVYKRQNKHIIVWHFHVFTVISNIRNLLKKISHGFILMLFLEFLNHIIMNVHGLNGQKNIKIINMINLFHYCRLLRILTVSYTHLYSCCFYWGYGFNFIINSI